ncbi:MAG: cell division protein FtsW [Planctomycetes bacterium]|nr:cell division protein FtsW [Planctomycetota bacterium]
MIGAAPIPQDLDPEGHDEQRAGQVSATITLIVAGLATLGVVLVYSSTSLGIAFDPEDAARYLRRQLLWVALATGVFVLARTCNLDWLRRRSHWILGGALLLLIAVVIPGVGTKINGACRWLRLAGINGQPSEIAKLALIIYVAAWCSGPRARIKTFSGLLPILGIVGLTAGLIAIEPDMGTALLVSCVSLMMLLAGGARIRHLVAIGLPGAGLLLCFAIAKLDYIWRRIGAFMDPASDPAGAGFQTRQALIALGSGGPFGAGLGASAQKRLFLPEVHTDYIFALVGEELGFVGAIAVLIAYAALIFYGLKAIDRARDSFAFLLAVGIVTLLGVQSLLNIAVATGSVPPKGIALPFLSFGGSSLLVAAGAAGLLARVAAEGLSPNRSLLPTSEAGDDDVLVHTPR